MPFLTGGEILTIRKVPSTSLKKGDLIFFRNSHGHPVLHRIIRKKRADNVCMFQTKGDSLRELDEPVSDKHVLGKVSGVERTHHMNHVRQINLESLFWVVTNYLAALNILTGSRVRRAVLKLLGRVHL